MSTCLAAALGVSVRFDDTDSCVSKSATFRVAADARSRAIAAPVIDQASMRSAKSSLNMASANQFLAAPAEKRKSCRIRAKTNSRNGSTAISVS